MTGNLRRALSVLFLLSCIAVQAAAAEAKQDVKVTPFVETPEVMRAFTQAVMYGVHRPVFNTAWVSNTQAFSMKNAENMAISFIESSIKQDYSVRDARYTLMYNSSADLFALVKTDKTGAVTAGFVPGRYFSENLYKIPESKQYLDNMLKGRPVVFRQLVRDFPLYPIFDDEFLLYRGDDELSKMVKINLAAFLKLTANSVSDGCRQSVGDAVNKMDFAFSDGRKSKDLGKFYLTIAFPILLEAGKQPQETVSFQDISTSRYGGYAVYSLSGKAKCKITKVVTTVY